MKKTIAIILTMLTLFSLGCTAAPETSQDIEAGAQLNPEPTVEPTPEPTPTPTPEPTPISEQAIELAKQSVLDGFYVELNPDFSEYAFDEQSVEDEGYGYLIKEEQIATATSAAQYMNELVLETLQGASKIAEQLLDIPITLTADIEPLHWKYLSAYLAAPYPEQGSNYIIDGANFEIELDAEGNMNAVGRFDYGTFTTKFLEAFGQDASDGFGTYSYLNTVFDDEGKVKDYVLPDLPEPLVYPVPGRIDLRDGWYDPRDGGDRFHTGMDIRAPEGTDIVSCSAGTVEKVRYDDLPGYYVQVIDDYGNRFFYCHMVELPDFIQVGDRVEAGQHIGDVGNTGNSAANHLHLTIYDAEGYLVNPYTYIVAAAENE